MRAIYLAALVMAVSGGAAFGVDYTPPAPAGMGAAPTVTTPAAPATPPAPASAASIGKAARVLVVPMVTLNLPSDKQWIGKAVQETLVADLGHTNAYSPIAFSGQVIVEDNVTAARLAREASASFAVRGAAQFVGNDVRLTAQMIDAKSGDTVATGMVTGRAEDLLRLEDELSEQLRVGPVSSVNTGVARVPGTGSVPVYTTVNAPGQAVPAGANLNQPLNATTINYPVYNDTTIYDYTPSYTPYYSPYYSYPVYYSSPIVFFSTNRFGGFHHFNHGGFHHGGFSHGGFGHRGFSSGISFGGSFHSGHFGGGGFGGGHFGGSGHRH